MHLLQLINSCFKFIRMGVDEMIIQQKSKNGVKYTKEEIATLEKLVIAIMLIKWASTLIACLVCSIKLNNIGYGYYAGRCLGVFTTALLVCATRKLWLMAMRHSVIQYQWFFERLQDIGDWLVKRWAAIKMSRYIGISLLITTINLLNIYIAVVYSGQADVPVASEPVLIYLKPNMSLWVAMIISSIFLAKAIIEVATMCCSYGGESIIVLSVDSGELSSQEG